MADAAELSPQPPGSKRLNLFERYLTLWVGLCMVLGVSFGKLAAPVSAELLCAR
jgi:ACR3 family arsenite transporter